MDTAPTTGELTDNAGRDMSLLLVDDDKPFLNRLARAMEGRGYSVRIAESVEAGLAAVEEAVPADVLTAALYARFRSRVDNTFGEKLLSAMREKFGGHIEKKG